MRRIALLALMFLTATATLSAQTAWHSLNFGESRDTVRIDLAKQGINVETSQDGTLQSITDYPLAIPGLRYPFPMFANFHFDTRAQLSDVTLGLDIVGMRHDWAAVGSDEALMTFATEKLTGALSGRYGAPLYRSTGCDTQPTFCIVSWRGVDQTIELERSTSPRGPRLLVRYQPLATDL